MASTGERLGEKLVEAVQEMVAVHRGEKEPARVYRRVRTVRKNVVAPPPEMSPRMIRELRERLGLSQAVFAKMLNCSLSSVKAWEQDLREPDGPSRRLLEIATKHPEVLLANIAGRGPEQEDTPAEQPRLRRAG